LQTPLTLRHAAETFDGQATPKGLFARERQTFTRTTLNDIAEEQTFERQERIGYVNY
jgi:hypothetical protein